MTAIFTLLAAVSASISSLSPAENAMSKLQGNASIYFGTKTGAISEVLDEGEVIILTDDTKWIVYPKDRVYTAGWLGPADVEITKTNTGIGSYQYAMTNKWTKKTVLVRRWPIGKVL